MRHADHRIEILYETKKNYMDVIFFFIFFIFLFFKFFNNFLLKVEIESKKN